MNLSSPAECVKGATVDLSNVVSQNTNTVSALVDAVGAALLYAPLPAPARATLVDYVSDGGGESQQLNQTTLRRKLPELVGLILASPVFQTH